MVSLNRFPRTIQIPDKHRRAKPPRVAPPDRTAHESTQTTGGGAQWFARSVMLTAGFWTIAAIVKDGIPPLQGVELLLWAVVVASSSAIAMAVVFIPAYAVGWAVFGSGEKRTRRR